MLTSTTPLKLEVLGGGLVFTATALVALRMTGGIDLFKSFHAQGEDEKNAIAFSKVMLLPLPSSSSPFQRPSIAPSTSHALSLKPSISSRPSTQPSSSPTATGRSISTPSEAPSTAPRPTSTPSSLTSAVGTFRLRLHWQQGVLWQGSPDERWFCMACARCDIRRAWKKCDIKRYCEEGMMLALVKCQRVRRRPKYRTFTLVAGGTGLFGDAGNGLGGHQIQVHDSNLCLQRVKRRHILLRRCDASATEQRFLGFRPGGQTMELLPAGGTYYRNGTQHHRCLTQHHHPKQGERIYARACEKAQKSNTNLWTTY